MATSAREFAYTLRSMRPSYAATLKYVRARIAELEGTLWSKQHARMRRYKAALKVLIKDPEAFK